MLFNALWKSCPLGKLFSTKTCLPARQALLIVKLTAIILLSACLTASANGYSQKVSLSGKNVPLEKIFSAIETQTNYVFFYNYGLLNEAKPVNIEVKNASLDDVLKFLFKDQPLDFVIKQQTIFITKKNIPAIVKEEKPLPPPPITVTGRVTNENGEPVAASIMVKGTKNGAITNNDGYFELKNVDENAILVITGVSIEPTEVKVNGKTSLTITVKIKAASAENVVVTGSRSKVARSSTNTVAPVDVFSSKDLAVTGQLEPTQMLATIAPSFQSAKTTIADGLDHTDPSSLRGMQPDQILILVNGKRRYTSALININNAIGRGSVLTDMNSIATSSIEKIEILRDGAAAQYGSDAIAGVINIVLKKSLGTTATYNVGQYNTKNFLDRHIKDGGVMQLGVNHGFKLGNKGGVLSMSMELRTRDSTNRSGDFTGTVYNTNKTIDDSLVSARGFSRQYNMHVGQSQTDVVIFSLNGQVPIKGATSLYFTGSLGYRDGLSGGFYRYPKQTTQVIAELYPNGFLPRINATIRDKSFIAGMNGQTKSNWDWDVSHTYGSNSFRFNVKNSNNASQYQLGKNAPTEFYAGKLKVNQNVTNVTFTKDFGGKMNLKSFNLALGSELRFDNFQQIAGEEASWKNYTPSSGRAAGSQVFPGYQPGNEINKTRTVISVFADAETDLTDKFLLAGAVRYENYSDFGSAIAGKVAARYKFAEFFTVRGALSNGFRAPAMQQRYFSAVATNFLPLGPGGSLVPVQNGTFRNDDQVTKAFGVQPLKAEKSLNMGIGLTSRFAKFMSFTLDLYQINVKDRILYTSSFPKSNPNVAPILAPYPDVSGAQFFTNAIDTKTKGLDAVLSATPLLGKLKLNLSVAANFNKTEIDGKVKGLDKNTNGSFDRLILDRRDSGRIVVGNPRDKYVVNVGGTISKFSTNIRFVRYGKVSGLNSVNPAYDETLNPKVVTDFTVSYNIMKELQLTLGANNVFDVYPDKVKYVQNSNEGRYVFPVIATQFAYFGRYIFATLSLKL